jgi:hypothetical protein
MSCLALLGSCLAVSLLFDQTAICFAHQFSITIPPRMRGGLSVVVASTRIPPFPSSLWSQWSSIAYLGIYASATFVRWSMATWKGRARGKIGILACVHRIASPGRFYSNLVPLILIHYRYCSVRAMLCCADLTCRAKHYASFGGRSLAAAMTPDPVYTHHPRIFCAQ